MDPDYTMSGAMANVIGMAPQNHSCEQVSDNSSADGQQQMSYLDIGILEDDSDNTSDEVSEVSGESEHMNALRDASEASSRRKSTSPGVVKKRASFNPTRRRQTAETRKTKACLRCRTQKTRCDLDPNDQQGPCLACKNFSKTSKKTIHLTPCFRGKITDIVLYRKSGLELTDRWNEAEMKDVGDRINPGDIRTIKFTLGICSNPVVVRVVGFQPQPGDVTARIWTVREGNDDTRRKKDLAHYCLADIHEAASYFEKYVAENAIDAMINQMIGPGKPAGRNQAFMGVIEKTYLGAIRHYHDLEANNGEGNINPELDRERKLLGNLFILWFATRHTTGSSWICDSETLGMKAETVDETYPLFGKVSVPRMILAQFDSIIHTRLLTKYGKIVLNELEALISRNQSRWWYTIYLCLFILLREASWMSEDRYRHARSNCSRKMRYSIPKFVEALQEGCNNLLHHWHYYNCRPWPDPASPWDRHKSFLCELSSKQYDLVMETLTDPAIQKQLSIWQRYKKENGHVEQPASLVKRAQETDYQGPQSQYDWDHPFYWISQLFEEQWQAHPTYQREHKN